MSRLLAMVGNDAAACPVLWTAAALGSRFGWDVDAVHVREPGCRAARAVAGAQGARLRELGGSPVEALIAAASAADVAAMVAGTRALPGAGRPLGHVPAAIAARVDKPLVLCAPDCRRLERIERVLLAVDGSDACASALGADLALLASAGVEAVLLHVSFGTAIPPFEDHAGHETEAWIREFVRRHAAEPGARVRLVLEAGVPPEAILRAAEREGADMIALGWYREPGRGRVAEIVLGRAPVPVALHPLPAARPAAGTPPVCVA